VYPLFYNPVCEKKPFSYDVDIEEYWNLAIGHLVQITVHPLIPLLDERLH
jgi:hypothetical protein